MIDHQNERITIAVGRAKWPSCSAIARNIYEAYQSAFSGKVDDLYYQSLRAESRLAEQQSLSHRVRQIKNKRIVILDHAPSPVALLAALGRGDFEVTMHVYGETIANSSEWISAEKKLLGSRIRFLCPSVSACQLFQSFLQDKRAAVRHFPYPIATDVFYFDAEERNQVRKRMGFRDVDRVFIYSGRLSLQKNVDILLKAFAALPKKFNNGGRPFLVVAGGYDDVGSEMLGLPTLLGYYFNKIQQTLRSLPREAQSRIQFVGQQSASNLRSLMNASDIACSLSLFHEEDFGMSIAESLTCGLRAIITDWGGYSDFALRFACKTERQVDGQVNGQADAVALVPVKLEATGPRLEIEQFVQLCLASANQSVDIAQRARRANTMAGVTSIAAAAKRVLALQKEEAFPFLGFNETFRQLQKVSPRDLWPVAGAGKYESLYRPYYRDGSKKEILR